MVFLSLINRDNIIKNNNSIRDKIKNCNNNIYKVTKYNAHSYILLREKILEL